ncbi:MAG: hypothetical protein K6G61_02550 [Solobacterium sp.]|nr:hypothetical protein [Solobacterium sp.]
MKKRKKTKTTAAGIIAGLMAVSFSQACIFNHNAAVYGPPPSASYDPDDNVNEDVYGPPEEDPAETPVTEQIEETYDPAENVPVCVYGPASYFEDEEPAEETAVPQETYDPEENVPADVYGPPPAD